MKKKNWLWILLLIIIVVVAALIFVFTRDSESDTTSSVNSNANLNTVVETNNNTNAAQVEANINSKQVTATGIDCNLTDLIIPKTDTQLVGDYGFEGNTEDWYGHIYNKEAKDEHKQLLNADGLVTIYAESGTPNSRYGFMQDLNIDVSSFDKVTLKAKVKADESILAGSGWQGREAPIAIGVVYYDSECVLHNGLSDDPTITANRMFWHGFYYQEPTDSSAITTFATKVVKGEWTEYEIDLTELDVAIIQSVTLEGAGWAPRNGSIDYLSLIVE